MSVRYVLEGSVRIASQLIDGQTDQHLWAVTYDRELEDVFEVQASIAGAIAAALETELSGAVAEHIERRPTDILDVYDLFVRGREYYYRGGRESVERAIDLFREALARDPEFVLARAWLGRSYGIYTYNHGMGAEWADSSIAIGRKAVAQQPDLPDAHVALATGLLAVGRFSEAEEAALRVLELNPNEPAATTTLGIVISERGRLDEAIRFARRSIEHSPSLHYSLACLHAIRGDVSGALRWLEEAIAVGFARTYYAQHDPLLANLRDEPCFHALLDQLWERIAAQRERVVREGL